MAHKKRLTQREVDVLYRLREKIDRIAQKYRDENDIMLENNGSVSENLDCASCSIEMILEDYLYYR